MLSVVISPLYPAASLLLAAALGAGTFFFARLGLGRRVLPLAATWAVVMLSAHAAWRLSSHYSVREAGQSIATALLVITLFAAVGLVPALALRSARTLGRGVRYVRRAKTGAKPEAARAGDAKAPRAPEASLARPAPTPSVAVETPKVSRRSFALGAVAVAPALSAGVGVLGIARANVPPLEPLRRIDVPELPGAFEGARILQISDVHLGFERSVADVERFVESVLSRGARPDLLMLTGDIADDLDQLDPALAALLELSPRWGTFACLGNHEYFHDVGRVRATFERRQIPLLVNEGVRLSSQTDSLWIAGVDDPIVSHGFGAVPSGATEPFYRAGVERALRGASDRDFKLLLSHRPEGFLLGARRGVDLTLSGHTHGGHVGFTDKSLIERMSPNLPMWGKYAEARSRLYVTSGFGHWFRFRLGCPTEAPWIELRGAPSARDVG